MSDSLNLEQLQKEAKTILKQCRAGDRKAIDRMRDQLPRLQTLNNEQLASEIKLGDVHHALARELGYRNWADLKRHDVPVARFLAAIRGGALNTAQDELQDYPYLSNKSIHVACAIGDVDAVRHHLKVDAQLLTAEEGGWPPLLYACGSPFHRLSARHALSIHECGNKTMIDLLLRHSATSESASPADQFIGACRRVDSDTAWSMLRSQPTLLKTIGAESYELLLEAVKNNQVAAPALRLRKLDQSDVIVLAGTETVGSHSISSSIGSPNSRTACRPARRHGLFRIADPADFVLFSTGGRNPFPESEFFSAIAASAARALLIGRRALIALGLPLLTRDYDFWIHGDDIAAFNAAILQFGLYPNHSPDEARARGRYALENDEKVDVIVARTVYTVDSVKVVFDDVWERRRLIEASPGVHTAIPSLEDLILTKRFGARPKDAEDIRMLEALRSQEST